VRRVRDSFLWFIESVFTQWGNNGEICRILCGLTFCDPFFWLTLCSLCKSCKSQLLWFIKSTSSPNFVAFAECGNDGESRDGEIRRLGTRTIFT
jgi:hypothetical protein